MGAAPRLATLVFLLALALVVVPVANAAAQVVVPTVAVEEMVLRSVDGSAVYWSITVQLSAREDYVVYLYRYDPAVGWVLDSQASGSNAVGTVHTLATSAAASKVKVAVIATAPADANNMTLSLSIERISSTVDYVVEERNGFQRTSVVLVETPNPLLAAIARLAEIYYNTWMKILGGAADLILSLLPDWLAGILRTSWDMVSGFAPPLFALVADIFKYYPFIFMLMSLKYIVSGDMEGWLNYVWYHVKIIRIFIDLGFKIIEAITP